MCALGCKNASLKGKTFLKKRVLEIKTVFFDAFIEWGCKKCEQKVKKRHLIC
jgi:hypothetical protein